LDIWHYILLPKSEKVSKTASDAWNTFASIGKAIKGPFLPLYRIFLGKGKATSKAIRAI